MKIISWNVNGIRAVMTKGFKEFIAIQDPDIICLQEIKATSEDFDFSQFGMKYYINSAEKKGYSGTAILTKTEPINVSYGLGIEEHDREGRITTAEFKDFYLISAYIPNSQRELKRLSYRLEFDKALHSYMNRLKEKKGVILTGDLNVAHKEIDIKNPKSNERNAGFTREERDDFSSLLSYGYIDTFRYFHPEERDAYTWWSYMFKAREKNTGWRIDYFVASENMKDHLIDSKILNNILGSDHCPIELELNFNY